MNIFTDKIELPAYTLVEIKRMWKALAENKESFIHNVFMDDYIFSAMREIDKAYSDYLKNSTQEEK